MDEPLASSSSVPKKRVLPSRTRRGGPGVGNCDADVLILETSKRQWENEPLIPKDTQFFLTTTLALAPPQSSSSSQKINSRGYERYFERPEVIKAYHDQMTIETPQFWSTADGQGDPAISVQMSRFRPRIDETQAVDTSDEAYLQRHRKYEKFEKRQRLREKEKLQHEQYKLHERVEQLRVMDYSAFLALPASHFSPPPSVDSEHDKNANGSSLMNGSGMAEGERRRKEMLAVAESLEARYRTLLPPRPWKKSSTGLMDAEHGSESPAPTSKQLDEGESEVEQEEEEEELPQPKPQPQPGPLKLRLNFSKSQSEPSVKRPRPPKKDKKSKKDTSSSVLEHPSSHPHPSTPRVISSLPPPAAAPSPMHPEIAVLVPDSDQIALDETDQLAESQPISPPPVHINNHKPYGKKHGGPPKILSFTEAKVLQSEFDVPSETPSETPANAEIDELASPPPEPSLTAGPPPKKRQRVDINDRATSVSIPPTDSPAPPIESISAPVASASRRAVSRAPRPSTKICGLVDAAQKYEKNKSGRRPRHNLAWGFKIPTEIFEVDLDFELPLWLLHDDAFQARYSKYLHFEEDPKYAQLMNPLFVPNLRFVNGQRMPTPENEKLVRALDSAHKEHGEDSQSESEDEAEVEGEQDVKKEVDGAQSEGEEEDGIVAYEDKEEEENRNNGTDEMAMKVDENREDGKDVESEDETLRA
ncbi:hypothetical protein GYMLUDRAFT_253996 [Collybiopsis luxurians FD-317 M1]|nr:hypothetical protein GYMLUDRAFT_253996 [Collybiopsis luxurians FD-317 M1]